MSDSVKQNLRQALRTLLKPIAKLLIAQGITHQEFSEAAKEAYVEMALRHFDKARKLNRSRVAILTGLTRKEVSNVIDRAIKQHDQGRQFSRPGRVLHGWYNDPEYIGPYGIPHEIPYERQDNPSAAPSFVHLVRTYSGDQSPKQMLEEMLRVGAIKQLEDGSLKANRRDFEPEGLSPKLIERFGDVGFNLLTTLAANVQKSAVGEGIFDRVVISNQRLNERELKNFEEYLKTRGQSILEEIDTWLTTSVSKKNEENFEASYESGLAMLQYVVRDPTDKTSLREYLISQGVETPSE